MTSTETKRVAVIGAGLNGLSILRRLSKNKKFQLTCFEKNYSLGGIWVYTDQTEKDIYGRPINTAVYNNLRTNIPKQLMELEGFPLDDHPSFPDHKQMLQYLNRVADACGIRQYIKFNTLIKSVKPKSPNVKDTTWLVTYADSRVVSGDNGRKSEEHTEEFDFVIVCSGNCSTAKLPVIEGEKDFTGLVMHSLQYRHPEMFAGQNVAVLGAHYSGIDISFDLSNHAKKGSCIFSYESAMEGKAKLPVKDEMVKIIEKESTRTIGDASQWLWDTEISEIAGNFKPLPVVLQKMWKSHFEVWAKDFRKCRSLKYEKVDLNSFKVV